MIIQRAARLLALSSLLCASLSAQAAIVVYTTEAAFLAATTNRGVDSFDGLSVTSPTPSPLARSAGAYGYTAATSESDFFGAGTEANPWLSTSRATSLVTFGNFTNGVHAIGGNFFGSNIAGGYELGSLTLVGTDASGSSTQTIIDASTASFLGFVSTELITSLTLSMMQPELTFVWPTVDNLIMGQRLEQVEPVPEPGSIALLLGGLGIVGALTRKRKV